MVSVARQFPSHTIPAPPIVSRESAVVGQGRELEAREIRDQLQALAARQAALQDRIRATRNALAALITLFGPGVLNHQQCQAVQSRGLFARRSEKTDLCREALQQSQEWLSISEILDCLRAKAPLSLAQFKNPGASVSNLLRMLQRRDEVAVKIENGERRWKWLGKPPAHANLDLHI